MILFLSIPVPGPAIIIIETSLIFAVDRFFRMILRAVLDLLSGQINAHLIFHPVYRVYPVRRYQDLSSRQPVAGIHHHVTDGPGIVIQKKIFASANLRLFCLKIIIVKLFYIA